MPLPKGTRYRWKTTKSGKKVRLAFNDGEVIEAKSGQTGEVHTPSEFAADRARRKKQRKRSKSGAIGGMLRSRYAK